MVLKCSADFKTNLAVVDLHLSYKILGIMCTCQVTGQQYPILSTDREFGVICQISHRNY